jgi:hypothetical protein
MSAAKFGRREVVDLLFRAGADQNSKTLLGLSAIKITAFTGTLHSFSSFFIFLKTPVRFSSNSLKTTKTGTYLFFLANIFLSGRLFLYIRPTLFTLLQQEKCYGFFKLPNRRLLR